MFKDEIIQTVILPVETPADQVEQLRQQRREAKAEYDSSWKTLQEFLHANPPTRRPFFLNNKYYAPVNLLQEVSPVQRALENQVARSKADWNRLQAQEADLLLRLRMIK